jgi:hypothetical protein
MSDDVPDCCTLPTAERPLRLAEFDELLASALLAQTRPAPTRLRWQLRPSAAATARDLAARETECCAFFRFTFSEPTRPHSPAASSTSPELTMDIEVPGARADVLDGLAARAAAALG